MLCLEKKGTNSDNIENKQENAMQAEDATGFGLREHGR